MRIERSVRFARLTQDSFSKMEYYLLGVSENYQKNLLNISPYLEYDTIIIASHALCGILCAKSHPITPLYYKIYTEIVLESKPFYAPDLRAI